MKTNNHFKIGDIVFNVDPEKLVVSKFSIANIDSNTGSVVLTRLGGAITSNEKKNVIAFSDLTKKNLYFETEEEANTFVKMQIGM